MTARGDAIGRKSRSEGAERVASAALWALLGLGVFFQLYRIGEQNFWVDELWTAAASDPDLPLRTFFREWVLTDVHPPVYMLLVRLWRLAFGHSELVLRAFSAAATIGIIPLVFLMNRWEPMVRRPLALAALLACSVAVVRYAQEARSYALLLLLTTAATLLAVAVARRMARGEAVLKPALALGAIIVAAGYVHYFGVLVGFGLFGALGLLSLIRYRRQLAPVVAACLGAAALLIPWIIFHAANLPDKLGGSFWIASDWQRVFLEVASLAGGRPTVFMAASALVAAAVAFRPTLLRNPAVLVPLVAGGLLVAAGAVISQHTPIVTGRNLMVLVPLFYLMVVAVSGDLEIARSAALRLAGVTAPVLLAAISLFFAADRMMTEERQHWREAAERVASLPGCRDATLQVYFWPEEIYAYYLPDRHAFTLRTFRFDERGLPTIEPPQGSCPLIAWAGPMGRIVAKANKVLGYEPGRIVTWSTRGHMLLLDRERLAAAGLEIPGLTVPE